MQCSDVNEVTRALGQRIYATGSSMTMHKLLGLGNWERVKKKSRVRDGILEILTLMKTGRAGQTFVNNVPTLTLLGLCDPGDKVQFLFI